MSDQSQTSEETPWDLAPLTPEYLEPEHGRYVHAINQALKNPRIHNIALSGNFGVGKSSILNKVAKSHGNSVVELSLSTLAPIKESTADDSVPQQAKTPTNLIQREIVKQLLYREEPNKTPGSRFQRIERFRRNYELALAALVAPLIALIFLLTGWTEEITTQLFSVTNSGPGSHLAVLAVAAVITFSTRYLIHGRIHIRQLSAGSATVTLDEKSVSYFDQYLDEIVYFFEVSGCEIVIFEDIDRFNDSRIFETLQSLNTLLNNSPQINNQIRFIYAIKDSIFDQTGLEKEGRKVDQSIQAINDPAQSEAIRANRTKFFDLVIPVVPFITHQSARNLTLQLLQEIEHDIKPPLIDLAARYVPDMRLLKNVRNEFIIFRDRIFSGEGEQLKLSETELFAMMLYKSTHLTDFEAIRIGTSSLDKLYELQRDLVRENIQITERRVRQIRRNLANLKGITSRSSQLGDQLIEHVRRTARAAKRRSPGEFLSFNGQPISEERLKSIEFWKTFSNTSGDPKLEVRTNPDAQPNLVFTRPDLAAALGTSLEPEDVDDSNQEQLRAELADNLKNLDFLKTADIPDLLHRPEFLVNYKGSEQSLDEVASDIFSEGLAYHLLRSGYINGNFTLYTSTFHGDRVSAAAMNFIIHHVKRNVMDEYFDLDNDDAASVIRECNESALNDSALYNIAILDFLLESRISLARIMIDSLKRFGEDQERFLQAYLNSGEKRTEFIKHFAASDQVLVYLVDDVDLDEKSRLELIDTALANLGDKNKYKTDSAVSNYLSENYGQLATLTSAAISEAVAEQIGNVFLDSGIKVPSLRSLSDVVQKAFISKNLYEINQQNLAIALRGENDLSLDRALENNSNVYRYLIKNLDKYLSAIDGVSVAVDSKSTLINVIENNSSENFEKLNTILAKTSENCVIDYLEDVPEETWPQLANFGRIQPTFNNVFSYIQSVGEVDVYLANLLADAHEITDSEGKAEEGLIFVANKILAAGGDLLSPSFRVKLVQDLELQTFIDVKDIPPEDGDLFPLLVKNDLIEDDADTYLHLQEADWRTREQFIYESSRFDEYVAPELVNDHVAALLQSEIIDDSVKNQVFSNTDGYIEGNSDKQIAQVARFARHKGHQLTADTIEKIAAHKVAREDVVALLEPHLGTVEQGQLFRILNSVGGEYAELTEVGRTRPRIANTPENRRLLDILKKYNIVNSYKIKDDDIKVNKRHK